MAVVERSTKKDGGKKHDTRAESMAVGGSGRWGRRDRSGQCRSRRGAGRAGAARRGGVRRPLRGAEELGPMGRGRRAGHGESRDRGEAPAGVGARDARPDGVALAQPDAGRGGGQPRLGVQPHDGRVAALGHDRVLLPRLRREPHRRAVPLPPQRCDVQRRPARSELRRGRLRQARHPEPEAGHRDARCAARHPAAEGRRLPGARDRHLHRGRRGVARAGGGHDAAGRRGLPAYRPLGAPGRGGALAALRQLGRHPRVGRPLDPRERRGVLRKRRSHRRAAVRRRGGAASRAHAAHRRPRDQHLRQHGPGSAGCRGGRGGALGFPDYRGADSGQRGYRFAPQRDRGVLTVSSAVAAPAGGLAADASPAATGGATRLRARPPPYPPRWGRARSARPRTARPR